MYTLEQNEESAEFALKKAGFHVCDGHLYLSVVCFARDQDTLPSTYCFAVQAFPILKQQPDCEFQLRNRAMDDIPNVHVYANFHAHHVEANVRIAGLDQDEAHCVLDIWTEDLHHRKHARSHFHGEGAIERKALSQLWLPA